MARACPDGLELRIRSRSKGLGPTLEPPVTGEGVFAAVDTYARVVGELPVLHVGRRPGRV